MFESGGSHWNFPALQVPSVNALEQLSPVDAAEIAAVVIEPLIQGAAGIRLWPAGTLRAVRELCNRTETLLIADEQTTALDVTIQAEILELIKSLQDEEGMSVMFITHDAEFAAAIAQRALRLEGPAVIS